MQLQARDMAVQAVSLEQQIITPIVHWQAEYAAAKVRP